MLVNAPLIDQRNEPTYDHQPDENASANCVPSSLASGVRSYFPQDDAALVDGDSLKDAVYGQGYTGATDPARYAAYLKAQFGLTLTELTNSSGAALVTWIRNHLALHTPVTGAIPSLWGNAYAGQDMVHFAPSTHEVLWCDDDGVNLTAMNPWGGFYQMYPYSWWAERIVYGRVFVLEGTPVGTVTPVWSEPAAGAGTLSYPAHDGIPAIVLVHAQAYYAHSSRSGVYPLTGSRYNAAGDDVVCWNDGRQSRAQKAAGWAVVLEDSGPTLAQVWAAADQVAVLAAQVRQLTAQVAAAAPAESDAEKAEAAAFRSIKTALAVS